MNCQVLVVLNGSAGPTLGWSYKEDGPEAQIQDDDKESGRGRSRTQQPPLLKAQLPINLNIQSSHLLTCSHEHRNSLVLVEMRVESPAVWP